MAFILSMMDGKVQELEKREAKPRIHTFSHASELARMCPFKTAMNQLKGESLRPFDLIQSSRVEYGESAEPWNLKETLRHSKAEYGLWPKGGLKVATLKGVRRIDKHSSLKSPTFMYDKEFNTGGRADAILTDTSGNNYIWECKTVAKEVGLDLFEMWQNPEITQDPVDWMAIQPKYFWVRPWPRQAMVYYWLASRLYGKMKGTIIIVRPLGMMPFYLWIDPLQYVDIIKQMLDRAYRIKECVNEKDSKKQAELLKDLYRVSGPDCSSCPWREECGQLRAEDKAIHGGVETVNDEVLLALLRKKEDNHVASTVYTSNHNRARKLAAAYLPCPEPGKEASRKIQVGEFLITLTWKWKIDQVNTSKLKKEKKKLPDYLSEEIKQELRDREVLIGKHSLGFDPKPLHNGEKEES